MNNDEYFSMVLADNNSLEHFGIPGMKWGQRRYQNEDGTYTEAGKERRNLGRAIKDRYDNYKERHKPVRKMTDQELQQRLNRARNEDQYKQLMAKNDPYISQIAGKAAKIVVGGILKTVSIPVKGLLKTSGNIILDGMKTVSKAGFQALAAEIKLTDIDRSSRKLKIMQNEEQMVGLRKKAERRQFEEEQRRNKANEMIRQVKQQRKANPNQKTFFLKG